MPNLNEKWNGEWNTTALVVLVTSTLAIYNALELLTLVPLTFKKWRGLYFWSLLVSSFAVLPYAVGFLINYLHVRPILLGDIINNIGWIVLVTGQSIVLYSRLGVILPDRRILRIILWMIIIDSTVFYITTTIVHYGTYSSSPSITPTFKTGIFYMEKIQMTGFCIQEFIISGLYVREVIRYSNIISQTNTSAQRTMWELFTINIMIIILDIGLLVMEYLNLAVFEQTFKGVTYSIKLKMESAILGKLVTMARAGGNNQFFTRQIGNDEWTSTLAMVNSGTAMSEVATIRGPSVGGHTTTAAVDPLPSTTSSADSKKRTFGEVEAAADYFDSGPKGR